MKGFDPEFTDLPHYIALITERIWEGRGVGLIRRYYSDDCPVHTAMGFSRGAEAMVAGTLETLHSFPDRRLLADDIIWSGDEEAGFYSSHRVVSTGHHRGEGFFGPATGRPIHAITMAECVVRENRIVEEWLVRDQAGMALQLGLDPEELGKRLAERDAVAGSAPWHVETAEKLLRDGPQETPYLQDHPAARLVRDALHAVWNETDLSVIDQAYDVAYSAYVPQARRISGRAQLDGFVIGYLAAFPDAKLFIDHSIARDDPGRPLRVATRWRLAGTHSGRGAFGPPSGAKIFVYGVIHSEIVAGRIAREWVLIDELALWKQIAS